MTPLAAGSLEPGSPETDSPELGSLEPGKSVGPGRSGLGSNNSRSGRSGLWAAHKSVEPGSSGPGSLELSRFGLGPGSLEPGRLELGPGSLEPGSLELSSFELGPGSLELSRSELGASSLGPSRFELELSSRLHKVAHGSLVARSPGHHSSSDQRSIFRSPAPCFGWHFVGCLPKHRFQRQLPQLSGWKWKSLHWPSFQTSWTIGQFGRPPGRPLGPRPQIYGIPSRI